MGSMTRKAIGGSIHKIREFELEKVNLAEEFDILQIVGEGWFGKILLVEHKATDTEMVLKALPKPYSALRDFYREFHYGLHLGAHRNIITTYDVAFETAGFYVFSQEYAPLGDLTSNVSETGIGELHTKRVARQLAAALEHLHVRDLVHRDVKLDNVLVFRSDFSRIKLCDFGETRRVATVVRRQNEWLPYAPPEVLLTVNDDMYKAETIHDVWQFGIVIFVCLTGCLPWQKAAPEDPRYSRYISWHYGSMPMRKQPKLFKLVSSKAQRLFRKFLEPKPEKRPATLSDVHKFLDDRWMAKGSAEKNNGLVTEDDGLCPSMYSFHSSPEEKNKLLFSLTQYGIETNVDRGAKKDRIRAWIENSLIEEEDEVVEEESEDEERVGMLDHEIRPVGERMDRGPIQATRVKQTVKTPEDKQKRRERRDSIFSRRSTEIYTPPIDPRIPLDQQRNSILHIHLAQNANSIMEKYFESKISSDSKSTSQIGIHSGTQQTNSKDIKTVLPFQNIGKIQDALTSQNTKTLCQENSQNSITTTKIFNAHMQNGHTDVAKTNNYRDNPHSNGTDNYKQCQTNSVPTLDVRNNPSKQHGNVTTQTQTSNSYIPNSVTNHPMNYLRKMQNNVAVTKTSNPYVQNSHTNPTQLNNNIKIPNNVPTTQASNHIINTTTENNSNYETTSVNTSSSSKKAENVYVHKNGRTNVTKSKPMKERFEMYGNREEKSTSSLSNSTGRSVSK